MIEAEYLIIGGGIAGAGAAYELTAQGSVILLEREAHCGHHATGRSAASFSETYGNATIRRLAIGSRPFLAGPPTGFADHPLLRSRGMVTIARNDQLEALGAELDRARRFVPGVAPLDPAAAIERVPVLRRETLAGAFIEPDCMEIDVDALHQGFLRGARARGAVVRVGAGVEAIVRRGGHWVVTTPAGPVTAPVLVNAAGAWADDIAERAGVAPLGLEPRRRTAFMVPAPSGHDITAWPLVNDVDEAFYFKPVAGQLFVSPADATPSLPVDAHHDDIDVAVGVERLEQATTIVVRRVSHAWAGLRTFAPDATPVVGPDETAEGFVWLAGQGGYGIKTSPALSRVCAALIHTRRLPDDLERLGLAASDLLPARLRRPSLKSAKDIAR